ncbi:hypothetical protein THAOC_11823 [Thalassiosira oceanica]|uniref:Leucine-rich repeat domain-containing protein n=1 Tax=Thalassiosira oceanica TaxID=159749 RepID=K0T9I5_THAOC|nr:hypothetical protein THAOC_11823 [Thalassiosira oceanica]|eukprot:EJK67177.1 hypothetical protein THAOC_11823 [Thalassiosira oceanica]
MDDDARGRKRKCETQFDNVFLYYKGRYVAEGMKSQITQVRIGPQVKDIPRDAFRGCINLAEVQFGEGPLEVIGGYAFDGCKALQEVAIPSSVTELKICAFGGCSNLAKVQFREGLEIIEDRAFDDCKALQQVLLPSSVTKVGAGAFWGCHNLAAVKLNEGLEMIGTSAFSGCRALQRVTIPSSVTKLGNGAFYLCSNLAAVQFSEGLEIIGEDAFNECTALRSVTVPSSVAELGYGAFGDCNNLTEVILLGGERLLNQGFLYRGLLDGERALNKRELNELIGNDAFPRCPLTTLKISVPRALCNRMEQPSGWNSVEDTNDETAESLHQVLKLISFHELEESSILIELTMWKSRLVEERARADCRTSVPDPAKRLIMEYCGFTGFLEPAIEGA